MLNGKKAVVTGGGRGIGRGITDSLLKAGATVLIAQRQGLAPDLAANPAVFLVQANLADPGAPACIAEAAAGYLGGVDLLVNNAGIMFEAPVDALTEDAWDSMMAINLRAPVFLAKALLGPLKAGGAGSVVNIGSIEGLAANPLHAAYCASKAGLHGLTRALAVDLGRDGIRCNAIAPGWIDSDLSNAYIGAQPDAEAARGRLLHMHPLGRTGKPGDVGGAVVFLASEAAAFITGEVLVVDGGRTAKLPLPF